MGGSAHGGDTFLTESLMGGSKKGAKKAGKATFSTATKPKLRSGSQMGAAGGSQTPGGGRANDDFEFSEDQSEAISDIEDEYRDVVYDVDQSRALVKVADDYLDGNDEEPLLALPAPGDDESEISGLSVLDDGKSIGGVSRMTGVSGMSKLSDRNFVQINRSAQGKMRPFLRQQRPTDRLAPD